MLRAIGLGGEAGRADEPPGRRERDAALAEAQRRLNMPAARTVVTNRLALQMYAAERGLPTPRVLGVLDRRAWGWCRASDRPVPPAGWAEALPAMPGEVVVRAVSPGVTGVTLRRGPGGWVSPGDAAMTDEVLAGRLLAGDTDTWLLEEPVHDHPALVSLRGPAPHPVRIVTLVDEDGAVGLHLAAVRVANPGPGSRAPEMWASVAADGSLGEVLGGWAAADVPAIPAGSRLPDWPGVRALAVQAAEAFLPLRTLALEIAVTPDGPVLLGADPEWSPLPEQSPGPLADALGIRPGIV